MSASELSWWYWRASAAMLTYGVCWHPMGYCFAGIISMVHIAHFAWREKSLTAFSVQVRLAYLAILMVAAWEPLRILYLAPFVGTWALVLYGYCFLARILSLMPWNRTSPASVDQFWTVLTAPPQQGSAFDAVIGGAGCRAMEREAGLRH
jgi:hypothetical protein